MMGFSDFDSSKGKKHNDDNLDLEAVFRGKTNKRKYR